MAVIKTIANTDYASTPIAYKRGNPIPIDTTLVWYDMSELETYAASGATAYVGQVLAYVDSENKTASAYLITNEAGALMKLASTTSTGDLAGDVATLQTEVNALKEIADNLGALASKDEITKEDLAEALKQELEGKANSATTLAGYGITDAYTKTEVDGLVSGAFHFKGEVNYQDLLPSDAKSGDVYVVKYMGTSNNAGTNLYNAEFAWDGTKWVEIGSIIDLSGYATKSEVETLDTYVKETVDKNIEANSDAIAAINNEATGILAQAKAEDAKLDEKIKANSDAIEAINKAETGILDQAKKFASEEDLKLDAKITSNAQAIEAINKAETGILAQAKTYTNEAISDLNNTISKDLSDNFVNKTQVATTTTAGLVKVDGTEITVDENGLMSVGKITGSKIDGNVSKADNASTAEAPVSPVKIKFGDDTTDISGSVTIDSFNKTTENNVNLILKNTGVNAGTYTKVTVDSKGRVTSATNITTDDVNGAGDIITHNVSEFATSEQGAKADTAIQSVSGLTSTVISKEDLKTATGFIESGDDITFSGDIIFNKMPKSISGITSDSPTNSLADKGYVDTQIAAKIAASDAMIYRGTVGTDGTVETLPTTGVKNGDTYKVVTEGVVSGATVGDLVIAVVTINEDQTVNIDWTVVPSGDDGNVVTDSSLTVGQLIVGTGSEKIASLANGEIGQHLTVTTNGLGWETPAKAIVTSNDESVVVTKSDVEGTVNYNYDISINKVSTDTLVNGNLVFVLDGGTSV